jgi:hypothetical protein
MSTEKAVRSGVSAHKSILLRLDPAVHEALARWADDELRSTSAQIEFLLRRALDTLGGDQTEPEKRASQAGHHAPACRAESLAPPRRRIRARGPLPPAQSGG